MIYADNAASTCMSRTALEVMGRVCREVYGNPSSLHSAGQQAASVLFQARRQIASALKVLPDEIYFTSGGSEADNQALVSAARIGERKGKKHLISTGIEHHAVLHTLQALKEKDFEISLLRPDREGRISLDAVRTALRPDTACVSVMLANNEIGTIEPAAGIGRLCREKGVCFHTDAVQAAGQIPVDLQELQADMASFSAHKFHGPKGVGFLYVRRGTPLYPLIYGGSQERGLRAGTENVPGIAAMAAALEEEMQNLSANRDKVLRLRSRMTEGLLAMGCRINGSMTDRLPGNVNALFPGMGAEELLLLLNRRGIAASAGSACTSGDPKPSHVLTAIGLTGREAAESVRFSFSAYNTEDEVEEILSVLQEIYGRYRAV